MNPNTETIRPAAPADPRVAAVRQDESEGSRRDRIRSGRNILLPFGEIRANEHQPEPLCGPSPGECPGGRRDRSRANDLLKESEIDHGKRME